MIKNYLISAIRYLLKYRSYAVLNVMGLSVGLACFILIGLWVLHEASYDQFHSKANRIFRVSGVFTSESDRMLQAVTSTPLRLALKDDFPEVEEAIIIDNNDAIVQRGDKQFMEDFLLMTDPAFFHLFDFELISGNQKTALLDPYSIVLSEKMAKKYFGDENPLGQSLVIFLQDPEGRGKTYTVTGVVEDCPLNSHFTYQALISFSTFELNNPSDTEGLNWYNNGYFTYVLLREGATMEGLQAKLPQLVEKYMGAKNREWQIGYEYFLQPITDIHLQSGIKYEFKPTNSATNLVIFGTIGIIVLMLACINYINMATAFASGRFKEVSMRKILGAHRKQLIAQHLAESTVLSMVALGLAIVWVELSRPTFESITGIPLEGLYTAATMVKLIMVTSLIGVISGIYPAVLLSGFRPASIIKGQLKSGRQGVLLRKSLVVAQYTLTILLVLGIIVVKNQLSFMKSKDLGFNPTALLVMGVNGSNEVVNGYDAFKNELLSTAYVTGVTRSNTFIAGGLGNSIGVMETSTGEKVNSTVHRVRTDFDYLDVYQMKLLAGRFFDSSNAADSLYSFIVNASLVSFYGYEAPQDVIGKNFNFLGREGKVIGVVKDFHYSSLQHEVQPTSLYLLRGNFSQISVRLNGNYSKSKEAVEQIWKRHFPNTVVDSRFAEESVGAQYLAEQRFSKVVFGFTIVSLAIACVGLFALVSFTVENRVKEIGIRKVLGASVTNILALLSREFIILIAISTTIAIPVGSYLMKEWLSSFAYRVQLGEWIFVAAGGLVVLTAGITISLRSIQAASANPVDSLRNE